MRITATGFCTPVRNGVARCRGSRCRPSSSGTRSTVALRPLRHERRGADRRPELAGDDRDAGSRPRAGRARRPAAARPRTPRRPGRSSPGTSSSRPSAPRPASRRACASRGRRAGSSSRGGCRCRGSTRGRPARGCRSRTRAGRCRRAGTTRSRPTASTSACSGRTSAEMPISIGRRARARCCCSRRRSPAASGSCAGSRTSCRADPLYASTRPFEVTYSAFAVPEQAERRVQPGHDFDRLRAARVATRYRPSWPSRCSPRSRPRGGPRGRTRTPRPSAGRSRTQWRAGPSGP